jgi:hypothetical protein
MENICLETKNWHKVLERMYLREFNLKYFLSSQSLPRLMFIAAILLPTSAAQHKKGNREEM